MFVGPYTAKYRGVLTKDTRQPHNDEVQQAGSCDVYNLRPYEQLIDLGGRLFIGWRDGTRAWVQRADNQNKLVTEVHAEFKEPDFPGFLKSENLCLKSLRFRRLGLRSSSRRPGFTF